jgi:aryl-alcohol dehydrogenase-like predicted oxidoreductase
MTTVPTRHLGELAVSAQGLGCMGMSHGYGITDDAQSIATLHHALDLGVTFLDTSDFYGSGHNEELIARAIAGRRDEVVLATKFGFANRLGEPTLIRGDAACVRQACEASLRRLGVDHIDLYYQHRVDPQVPIEETVGAMARLREAGKVRALGLSEAAPETIRRAHRTHPISAVQTEYSPLYRSPGEETLAVCRELGITFVAYSPLGRSLLTGTVHGAADLPEGDRRRQHPRFQDQNLDHNVKLVRRLEELAAEKGVRIAQLVLAWLLARGDDVIPIPGSKRLAHLEENVGALDVRLDPADLKRIDEAMPVGAAAGTRYPEPQMKGVQL